MSIAETRVGVDVGGTFTDVILHGGDGRVVIRKLLSTPPSYDRAVVEAVGGLAAGPIAESVLAEAEEKATTESEIRAAVREGMSPLEAYERYGTF